MPQVRSSRSTLRNRVGAFDSSNQILSPDLEVVRLVNSSNRKWLKNKFFLLMFVII